MCLKCSDRICLTYLMAWFNLPKQMRPTHSMETMALYKQHHRLAGGAR